MGVVSAVHRTGTQIGDFNYLGVLVQNGRSLLIDADSFQFGKFKCRSFTTRFVDPTLCKKDQLLLAADPSELSDWYAFALMVFECLTFTSPYGGVVKAGQYQKLPASDRPLRRVSVLSKDVQYPVKGVPLDRLPDEFLEYYHQLLEKDVRGVFPQKILEQMRWTRCPNCDWEFAKRSCPMCAVKAPSAYFVEDRRGKLLLRPIFRSNGRILAATLEGKMLRYLYHENGAFYREGSGKVIEGALGGKLKVRLLGSATYFSEGDTLAKVDPPHPIQVTPVDSYRGAYATFDSNGDGMFHVSGGRLVRTGELGERFLARVLANQTLFWVGPKFGLATYRAGNIRSTIVFDAENGAVNEVALPRLSGDPLDAACYFTSNACWYFVATQERSETIHHCFLISKTGEVLASRSEKEGSDSWLDSFTGKVAMTMSKPGGKAVPSLLSIGEHGLLRIELDDESSLVETTRWTDARGVLRPTDKLLLGADGLFVIRPNEIINVKVS
jgi:H/ACA ribonucleoprotein complex subunit 3